MPYHTACLRLQAWLGSTEGMILVGAHYFLDAAVGEYAITEEEQEMLLGEEVGKRLHVGEYNARAVGVGFPRTPERQWCADGGILESIQFVFHPFALFKFLMLGMTGRHGELCGGEERGNKVGLVGQVLANAFFQRHDTALQLNDTKGNTIDIYHDVGA